MMPYTIYIRAAREAAESDGSTPIKTRKKTICKKYMAVFS